jgi:hypothetical protein
MRSRQPDPYLQLSAALWFLSESHVHRLVSEAHSWILEDFRKKLAETRSPW